MQDYGDRDTSKTGEYRESENICENSQPSSQQNDVPKCRYQNVQHHYNVSLIQHKGCGKYYIYLRAKSINMDNWQTVDTITGGYW